MKLPSKEQAKYLEEVGIRCEVLGKCEIKPIDWAVKGLIPTSGITVLYGASGSGKTFLAAHLALCIASGADFLKHKVKNRGTVIYLAAESPTSLERRLAVMSKLDKTGYGGYEFNGQEVAIFKGNIDLFNKPDSVMEAIKVFFDPLLDPIGICIIDTLSAAYAGLDENSGDMALVVKQAEDISRELLCPVVIVHHTGKDTTRGLRGHSSLRGNIEQALYVDYSNGQRSIKVDKIKDEKLGDEVSFDLISIDTGIVDEDGEIVKGCLVQYGAFDSLSMGGKAKGKLTPQGETALKAFNAALESIAPSRYVSEALFKEHLKPLFKHHGVKHMTTKMNRGIDNLINTNRIQVNERGDYVYC